MPYATIPMVPGPVSLHPDVIAAISRDYGSGLEEPDFLPLYADTSRRIAQLMGTANDVALMSGEGMLALWAALKSCLKAGDAVVSVGTGVFGDGIGEMAATLGCTVHAVSLPYDSTIGCGDSLQRIEDAIRTSRPVMLTAVHCETPSGTLNPLDALGEMKRRLGVPLFYVDAVSSLGGALVQGDEWHVDLLLAASHKCLSAPPSMSMVGISEAAWEHMERVRYHGYDALLPFRALHRDGECPYTPNWHGIAALHAGAGAILREGHGACLARHKAVARRCRDGLALLGISLFPADDAVSSPTVTAARIPTCISWPQWQMRLRQRGLIVTGSLGSMNGTIFRIGHMGVQARVDWMDKALAAIDDALRRA